MPLFYEWLKVYNPDGVSRKILWRLLDKYNDGNDLIFAKMPQLEMDELFSLCRTFKSLFDYVGINDDYLRWRLLMKNY